MKKKNYKNKEETRYVCFCTDNNGVQDMAVCIESLFCNNKFPLEVFIIYAEDILEKEKVLSIGKKYNQKITFIKINPAPIKGLPLNGWPEATYYRLLLPNYIPEYVHKLLYLDTDTLVDADISPLFDYDISKFSVAACPSPGKKGYNAYYENFLRIPMGTCFGAGILLINLDKIRKDNLFDKMILFGKKNPTRISAVDQDLLNIFFYNDYFKIPPEYHCALFKGTRTTVKKENAKIIHYTGKDKPQKYICLHPLRNRYLFYLEKTPWKGNYEKFTVSRFLLRQFNFTKRRLKNSFLGKLLLG